MVPNGQNHNSNPILSIRDLSISLDLPVPGPPVRVIEGVSFDVARGEILGIVGESGSGKSVTSLAVLRLLPSPPWRRERGQVLFAGRDLYSLDREEMRQVRGKDIAVVFQEPMTALNPYYTIGEQVEEVLTAHLKIDRKEARARAVEALDEVGIPGAADRAGQFPHQLSGGLKQRAMIASALVLRPKLLLADEPTTALDLTIQAQIIDLISRLSREFGMAVVFITHDLALIRGITSRTAVMYAGHIVESAQTGALFGEPLHPYTRALIDVIPDPAKKQERLASIPGRVPKPGSHPPGCPFGPRCGFVLDQCTEHLPELREVAGGRSVRCWLY